MKLLWRIGVAIVGGTVLLFGIALIFLPGPSILVIPLGLGILALEFAWARAWLARFRIVIQRMKNRGRASPDKRPDP